MYVMCYPEGIFISDRPNLTTYDKKFGFVSQWVLVSEPNKIRELKE